MNTEPVKMPEAREEPKKPVKKRSLAFRIFKYSFLSLFLIFALVLAGAGAFGGWVTQTNSGQAWLVETVNRHLGPKEDQGSKSLAYRITRLEGSLPFDFQLGLEVYDSKGLFCVAPDNSFQLNWRELPGAVVINELILKNVDLSRFPDLPSTPKTVEPEKPLTLRDLQNYLTEAADFLNKKHWWLPNIKINEVALTNAIMPPDLIEKDARLALNANLKADMVDNISNLSLKFAAANENKQPVNFGQIKADDLKLALNFGLTPQENALNSKTDLNIIINKPELNVEGFPTDYLGENLALTLDLAANADTGQKPSLKIALTGPDIHANHINMTSKTDWDSGLAWQAGEIDGPINLNLVANILPDETRASAGQNAPLNILAAPVNLNFNAQGNLPKISLQLALDANKLVYDKYIIENADLKLATNELDIPLSEQALEALAKENQLHLDLSALVEKEKIVLGTELFVQALEKDPATTAGTEKIWRAGLRKLNLNALGASLIGELAAFVNPAEEELSRKILLDGDLALNLRQWSAIDKLIPNQKINGDLQVNINLASGADNNPLNPADKRPDFARTMQLAKADILARNFNWQPKGGQGAALGILQVTGEVKDPLADTEFTAQVKGEKIRYDKFDLGLALQTEGKPKGPIKADLSTTGSVVSRLSAEWEPGLATLKALNVKMNSAALLGGKGANLGVELVRAAQVSYGEGGLGVKNLDIKIMPSGRLSVNGSLTRDKMDMALALDNLKFKPWQEVIPQIPGGEADIRARITGEPHRPGGSFQVQLKEIVVPGNTIPPVSLNLGGVVRNAGAGSVLAAQLDIDPKTVKLLGGSVSQINAQIPLIFAENGVPNVNMNGPLNARVVWDGALGPIWNLLPLADQRVNGRININIDAGGTLKTPRIRGGVKIDKARYENILYGVLLTDINARVDLSQKETPRQVTPAGLPGSMALALSLSDGHGGTLKVNGTGALNGDDLDVTANMDHLKPLRRRDIHVELSGNAKVTGAATAPNVKGQITVNRGEVLLDNLSLAGGSVTTLDITEPVKKGRKKEAKQETPAQPKGEGSLDIRIVMLPRFTVEGRGLGSIWEANLLVTGTPQDPKITGSINCVSGNFDFLGKNFALSKGQVTFAGGSLSNPLLDIDLTNETPDLTAHILILGPVSKMRLVLTSDPSLPRDDILSRVLFGKSVNDLSRLEALQLAGAVAQLAGFGGGGGILNFTKKALGLDVLRIGTSSSDAAGGGDDNAGGTTIEAGQYLNDYTYMGVQQGLTPDSTAFIIQLELTPRTSLEVRTENNNTWGGLNWKYNY